MRLVECGRLRMPRSNIAFPKYTLALSELAYPSWRTPESEIMDHVQSAE